MIAMKKWSRLLSLLLVAPMTLALLDTTKQIRGRENNNMMETTEVSAINDNSDINVNNMH
jgi:hypothetical protein